MDNSPPPPAPPGSSSPQSPPPNAAGKLPETKKAPRHVRLMSPPALGVPEHSLPTNAGAVPPASNPTNDPAKTGNGASSANKKSRFTKTKNQVHPATSPPPANRFSSQHDLTDETGLVVPAPQPNVAEGRRRKVKKSPNATRSTRGLSPNLVQDESVTDVRSSPGRTQVPLTTGKDEKSDPFKSGIHALKVAPKESGLRPDKSVRSKKNVINFKIGATALEVPPVPLSRSKSSEILDKGILAPHEVPKSAFLQKRIPKSRSSLAKSRKEEVVDQGQGQEPVEGQGQDPDRNVGTFQRSIRNQKAKIKFLQVADQSPSTSTSRKTHKERPEYYRQQHLKQLHAKYSWRRFYTMIKGSLLGKKEEEAEKRAELEHQRHLEALRQRIAERKKKKKPKKGCFAKLIDFLDEDENSTTESSSDDAEEQILKRMSFQQMTLGERRQEIRNLPAEHTVDIPELPLPMKNRRESKVIRTQQVSAAVRRIKSGGSLGLEISANEDPLRAENIESALNYEAFARKARGSLPSGYAMPHDDTTMKLFDQLVPLLRANETETEQERMDAAADAFDEFRVAKLHAKKQNAQPERRLSDIRFLPGNLGERRGVMTEWEDSRAQEATGVKRFKNFFKDNTKRVARGFSGIFENTRLWYGAIHQIEMNFGVSAATYFRWLRSVILLNTLYAIFSLTLIVIPEAIIQGASSLKNITSRSLSDFILAENYNHRSVFFYGAYKFVPHESISYSFESTALRFVIVIILITLMDTLFIGLKVRNYYKRITAKVSDSDKTGEINFFAVFLSAWDYNLTSETAVKVQHRTIARDFNHMMDVYERQLKRQEGVTILSTAEEQNEGNKKWSSIILHWSVNLAVLVAAVGFGFLIHMLLTTRRTHNSLHHGDHDHDLAEVSIAIEVAPAIVIAVVLNCFSPICAWLTSFETFDRIREKVFVVVYRIGVFYVSVYIVLYIFWITNSIGNTNYGTDHCWEEEMGVEIYRLVTFEGITNALITILRYVLLPAIKAKWTKRRFEKSVFDVEYFTLNLIFVHTLTGVGTFFFPLLPLLAIARLLITFYFKRFVLERFCAYPTYQLHPSEIFAPYVVAFFFSFLGVVFTNSWLMSEDRPSNVCGPFQGYSNDTYSKVFHVMVHSGVGNFTRYIVSPWFLIFVIIILGAVVYTFRAWTHAYFDTMNLLHDLLRLERLDREFLLRAMYSIPGIRTDDKFGSGGPIVLRRRGHTEASLELFMQQQEALSHLFDETRGGRSNDTGSSESRSQGSSVSTLSSEHGADLTELPTERAKRDRTQRRHRHLTLPAKALRLLSATKPRRLSMAGKMYTEVVGKALTEMNEEAPK